MQKRSIQRAIVNFKGPSMPICDDLTPLTAELCTVVLWFLNVFKIVFQ